MLISPFDNIGALQFIDDGIIQETNHKRKSGEKKATKQSINCHKVEMERWIGRKIDKSDVEYMWRNKTNNGNEEGEGVN